MDRFKPYVKKLARFGCYSISAVYILVGFTAILSFLGLAEDDADEERIVDVILELPFGEVLIVSLIAGLIGYIIWRIFEAYTDPYNFGNDKQGITKRVGISLSAVGYILIAFAATQILIQGGGGDSEEEQKSMVAQVLGFPGGPWLIGISGVVTGLAGLVQFKYVAAGDYIKRINLQDMPKWMAITTHVLAWAGHFARGIILGIIGYFFISAGLKSNPEEVGDTDTAFDFIGSFGTVGHIIFIAVALGTIGYGIFMIVNGYYYSFEDGEEKKEV